MIEDAVRNLVRMRFDGPGMRWGRTRAEKLLHLRCILLNGQWGAFTESGFEADEFRLRAQPERARVPVFVDTRPSGMLRDVGHDSEIGLCTHLRRLPPVSH